MLKADKNHDQRSYWTLGIKLAARFERASQLCEVVKKIISWCDHLSKFKLTEAPIRASTITAVTLTEAVLATP